MTPTQALRLHTQTLHTALEDTAIARDLLSPTLTIERYAQILGVWAGAWEVLENLLWNSALARMVPTLVPPRRLAHAHADLRYLTMQVPASEVRIHRPRLAVAAMPAPSCLSSYLGICYVVRGAALGGRVIARHLQQRLHLDSAGARFFSEDESSVPGWPQWMREADRMLADCGDIAAAQSAAQDAFGFLITRFAAPPPVMHMRPAGAIAMPWRAGRPLPGYRIR